MSCAALLVLLCAAPQWPEDARQLLLWHETQRTADAGGPPDAAALRGRLYAYQAAGAEAEAWAAARALENLAPSDPDGDRYRIQLCVWDPALWPEGLALAERWLRQNAARPEQERSAVAAAQTVLQERLAVRAAADERRRARGWVAWLAAALFLTGSTLAVRGRS